MQAHCYNKEEYLSTYTYIVGLPFYLKKRCIRGTLKSTVKKNPLIHPTINVMKQLKFYKGSYENIMAKSSEFNGI